MLVAVLIRRLRERMTYADFREAWVPEHGFGREVRVLNAVRVDDDRELVSIGFVPGATRDELPAFLEQVAVSESRRHEKIERVVEAKHLSAIYEVVDDVDLS